MATADVRDVLDLPNSEVQQRPAKKAKVAEKRPDGISRELYSLLGERAAPVSITQQVRYKERPKWNRKVAHWESKPFRNQARDDGLVLRHWQRKAPIQTTSTTSEDAISSEPSGQLDAGDDVSPVSYHFAKFNVKVNTYEYTEAEYETHLRSPEWTKEETDYLFDLCKEYDLRWVIIADRYSFVPSTTHEQNVDPMNVVASNAVISQAKRRTMEDLKARYYTASARVMALRQPMEEMTPQEFAQHEMMSKFDPAIEARRKEIATNLARRSAAEVDEEAILLTELRRILSNQDRLSMERSEIYSTLDSPHSSQPSAYGTLYQSSVGLHQLMQQLLQADKNKKKQKSMAAPSGELLNTNNTNTPNAQSAQSQVSRESLSGPSASISNKRGAAVATPQSSVPRALSPASESRFGVSHHERLSSGTALRHERVNKLAAGKSNIQAARLAGALTELEIPPRLVMPTQAVCEIFEQLVQKINALLDIRKQRERVQTEIRVLEASKGVTHSESVKPDQSQAEILETVASTETGLAQDIVKNEGTTVNDTQEDDEKEDKRDSTSPGKGHKRSASVISHASSHHSTSKRSRK